MNVSNDTFYFEGGEQAILLFHSYTSTPIDVRTIGRVLSREGYTVYSPLFTYHGGKIEETLEATPEEWYRDGLDALAFLKDRGFKQIAAFGISLGGIIATRLWVEHPEVIGGGTFCSPMIPGYHTNTPEIFVERFKAEKREEGWEQDEIESAANGLQEEVTQKIIDKLDIMKQTLIPKYAEVNKPIFIAQGMKDQVIDPLQAIKFKDMFDDSQVSFHQYEGGGHVLTVGEFREVLSEDLLNFLNILPWK